MKRLRSALLVALACLPAFAPVQAADTMRTIQWQDLGARTQTSDNPFSRLTRDQLSLLSDVASVRDRRERGDKSLTATELGSEQSAARKLEQGGLDVEALLAKRREMSELRKGQGAVLNRALEGQLVRVPGYLLPLELKGRKVTEFLLVPWVGACIHTPPPPPNQIVHVKPDVPYEMSGMFEPIWVMGRLSLGAAKKSLYMVDGSSDIDIGYTISATRVEPYKP
ncbi:MAG: DUF3299 domain-containing protein [Burkholderiales bacterium]